MPKNNSLIQDFTEGPILSRMFWFALPFIGSNALQVLYSLADMVVVGHVVGRTGLSAVALTSQLFLFMTMFCVGMCQGGQVLLSQLIGANHREKLGSAIGTLFTTLFAFGALMSLAGFCFARPILHLLNAPQDSMSAAYWYMIICSGGILSSYGYNICAAVMRGLGDSRHPFWFIVIAAVLNIVLDLLFVAVFKWGVPGAALATIISQAVSFICAAFFLYLHREGIDFFSRGNLFSKEAFRALMSLGLPLAARFCVVNVTMLAVYGMVAKLGSVQLSTFGVGVRLDDLANKLSLGVMMATTGMVAQNYAAGKYDRVRKIVRATWFLSAAFYLIFAFFLCWMPRKMFGCFTSDQEVLDLCPTFVRAILWSFPGLLLLKGTNGFLHGTGKTTFGLILGLLDGCIFRLGASYLFGIVMHMGFYGYVLGYGLGPWGSALAGLFYFLFGSWEKSKRPDYIS